MILPGSTRGRVARDSEPAMPRRPTPVLVAVLALVVGVTGCGSQGPPEGGSPGQNASQVPGTRPSQTVPPGFQSTPAPGAPSNSTTTTATVPADATGDTTTFAIVDQETGDFAVGLGGDHLLVLQIGIHGVGKAWNTKRATVHRLAGVTVLRYDGPGRLDARARLDGPSAMSALPVDPRPAHLRVQARMTAD